MITKDSEKELELRTRQYEHYRNILLKNEDANYNKLENIVYLNKKNKYKQVSASKLKSFIDSQGDICLLPSSDNYNWKAKKEKVEKYLNYGKVIALGRARYPNIKYCEGFFVSSNNNLISIENENKILMRYLFHFIDSKKYSFYIETSTYPKFDSNIFKNTSISIPTIKEQQNIVETLDKFHELEKELELRKK